VLAISCLYERIFNGAVVSQVIKICDVTGGTQVKLPNVGRFNRTVLDFVFHH